MAIKNVLFIFSTVLLAFGMNSCEKDPDKPADDEISKHINDSLWAYYPLNGNTNDASNHNHVLTLNNGAKLNYDTWGTDNSSLELDGVNDYAIIQDGSLFPSSNFSVSLFVMPRQNKGLFFGKQDFSTAKGASFNVGIDDRTFGDIARFSITTNQAQICNEVPASGNVILNNKAFYYYAWYHVVITFDKGTMKFYVNGNLVGDKQINIQKITACENAEFVIGGWWANDLNAFDGKIDELRIYTRAISEKEVKYLFEKR